MADNANPWAVAAARGRISANEALRQLRAEGNGIRRQDFLTLVREIRGQLEAQSLGYDRRGDRRPYRREIQFFFGASVTGFVQYIDVWVKSHETGEVYPRPYGLRTDELMTHDDAVATALDRYSEHADKYGESILGASYMATYEYIPGLPPTNPLSDLAA